MIWENHRYSSTYVVDRGELDRMVTAGLIPVVHLGQAAAVGAVVASTKIQWIVTELWCPRETAVQRIVSRATGDVEERLQAWDATEHLAKPDLLIDTSLTSPREAAELIKQRTRREDCL